MDHDGKLGVDLVGFARWCRNLVATGHRKEAEHLVEATEVMDGDRKLTLDEFLAAVPD